MSWGIKILLLYLGFVALIVTMVGLTMRENVDLVSDDYYQQELEYQKKINTIERTALLKEPLTWRITNDTLVLEFPNLRSSSMGGSVFFFRPSDAQLDQKIPIPDKPDSIRRIPVSQLESGLYRMQIDWHASGTSYYNESMIQIP